VKGYNVQTIHLQNTTCINHPSRSIVNFATLILSSVQKALVTSIFVSLLNQSTVVVVRPQTSVVFADHPPAV